MKLEQYKKDMVPAQGGHAQNKEQLISFFIFFESYFAKSGVPIGGMLADNFIYWF